MLQRTGNVEAQIEEGEVEGGGATRGYCERPPQTAPRMNARGEPVHCQVCQRSVKETVDPDDPLQGPGIHCHARLHRVDEWRKRKMGRRVKVF
jgi:hypothetical protein